MANVTSINRLTGLATGLDIDSLVKSQMRTYQNKINTMKQQKEVTEIRQKLYRDILTDTRSFYNKYLDPLSKDNLIMSTNYKSVEFKSSNSNVVTATASSTAKPGNYTIKGTAATASTITIVDTDISDISSSNIKDGEKIIINHKEFTLKGKTKTEIVKNLNTDFEEAGLAVKAKYTNFAGSTTSTDNKSALIIETTELGAGTELQIGGNTRIIGETISGTDNTYTTTTIKKSDLKGVYKININNSEISINGIDTTQEEWTLATSSLGVTVSIDGDNIIIKHGEFGADKRVEVTKNDINVIVGETVDGTNGSKAIVKGINVEDLRENSWEININGNKIQLNGLETLNDFNTIKEKINTELKNVPNFNFEVSDIDENGRMTFESTNLGSNIVDPKITVGEKKGTFTAGTDGTNTTTTIKKADLDGVTKLIVNGKEIPITASGNNINIDELNEKLKNIKLSAALDGDNIVIKSDISGEKVEVMKESSSTSFMVGEKKYGTDAKITITNEKGGVYHLTDNKNSITLDGVTFNFKGMEIPKEGIEITGTSNVTNTKDKIVKFIDEYNTLIEKLNTAVNTKHDRSYVPLTSDQKEAMTDKEIELWEKKVQEGLLYKDSDITRVADSMKEAMRTIMLGTGTSLEKIGITPVKDYSGNKNGTFSIDEAKLESALENNIEDVMKLFTNAAPKEEELLGLTDEQIAQRKNQTGIIYKLKNSLYNQVMISDSVLAKKVGIEGTSTFTSNTLTKNISDYEAKIKKMNSEYSRKEQLLYSKYANLERIMNKYNSQLLYLSSYLGS